MGALMPGGVSMTLQPLSSIVIMSMLTHMGGGDRHELSLALWWGSLRPANMCRSALSPIDVSKVAVNR